MRDLLGKSTSGTGGLDNGCMCSGEEESCGVEGWRTDLQYYETASKRACLRAGKF